MNRHCLTICVTYWPAPLPAQQPLMLAGRALTAPHQVDVLNLVLNVLHLCCLHVMMQVYGQVQDMPGLVRLVETYLEDYNSTSTSPMKLVLFLDAIEHVSRICRIIRQPLGNALLLGVGGSGRQSLARLAAFMCDYEVVQIEIAKGYGNNEWREVRRPGRGSWLQHKSHCAYDVPYTFSQHDALCAVAAGCLSHGCSRWQALADLALVSRFSPAPQTAARNGRSAGCRT